MTSSAIVVAKPSVSNAVMAAIPDLPWSNASHVERVSKPSGVTIPIPVT